MFTINPCDGDLCSWCRYIFAGDDYVFLDTETTGLKSRDQVIDLAVVGTRGQVLLNALIRPTCSIQPKAQAIHGITSSMLRSSPTFKDLYPKILEAIGGRGIIGWNIKFDLTLLEQTAEAWHLSPATLTGYCLMTRYADFKWLPRFPKLEHICEREALDLGKQEHRALSDTMAVYALARKLAGPKTEYSRYLDWRERMEGA